MTKARYVSAERYGSRVRSLRKRLKMSTTTLAKKTGFTQQLICQVELGQINTPIETLARIAEGLGGTIEHITGAGDEGASSSTSCLDEWARNRPVEHRKAVEDFLQYIIGHNGVFSFPANVADCREIIAVNA